MELSNPEIQERLIELPNEIWRAAEKARLSEEKCNEKKAFYESEFAKQYMLLKAEKPDSTVKDLEAETKVSVYEFLLEYIKQEADMKKWRLESERAKDKFDALRSLIKFKVAEMQTLGGSV